MPELIGDAALYQNPLDGAARTYEMTPPAEGAGGAMSATVEQGPGNYMARAAQRGAFVTASPVSQGFAAMSAQGGVPEQPLLFAPEQIGTDQSPIISADEANALAPEGTTITDKPIQRGLAEVLAKQKADQIRRDSILSRYNADANPVKSFALETLASFGDPLNAATLILPGVGSEALAARLGTGIAARTGARLLAGAATGAAQQAPLSALRYGLSQDEFADYGLRDAFRDIAFGAAGAAILNAGVVGGASEFLRWRRGTGPVPAGVDPVRAAEAAPIIDADAQTDHAAMRAATGEILDARPVDVEPVIQVGAAAGEAPGTFRTTVDINGDRATVEGPTDALRDGGAGVAAPAARAEPALIGEPVPGMPAHGVATATGERVDVAPVVVEGRDLRTSADEGYDPALQPRDRERAAAEQQVREIAGRLEPERLGMSAEADRGAPIVGPDGMVESGNGRTMAIRQAYAENGEGAQRYRDWLGSQGVDAGRYDEPILVRQRLTPMSPGERQAFAVAANRPATLALSAPERALADARAITPDMLGLIRNPDDLGAVANRDFVRAFVEKLPQAEQGMMATAGGDVSAEGLARVRNAVLAGAYGNDPVLSRIAEATHDEAKSISNALVSAAPHWARLRADIAAGRVRGDVDLTGELLEAVRRTADLRAKGTRLADFLAQQDAFDRLATPVENWMRVFYDPTGRRAAGAARIAEALKTYATEARKVSADRGLDLGLAPVTAGDLQHIAAERSQGQQPGLLLGGGAGDGANHAENRGAIPGSGAVEPRRDTGSASNGGARSGQGPPRPAELSTDPAELIRDAAENQRLLNRDGWAPGISQGELNRATETIYGGRTTVERPANAPRARAGEAGPRETEPGATPGPAGEQRAPEASTGLAGADPELAEAEARAATINTAALLPEERAEIEATRQAVAEAHEIGAGAAEAAACITGGAVAGA